MRKTKIGKKIFPFAPKILWTLNSGKYVKPTLQKNIIDNAVKNKSIVVVSFGNIFESFFSFTYLELFDKIYLNNFYWAGDPKFLPLLKANGLADYFSIIKEKHLNKFTTPIFLDRNDRVYFNSLYNYRDVKSFYNTEGYHCNKPVCKQIFSNSCFSWNENYIPQLRYNFKSKFDTSKKYILVMPDETIYSDNKISCLNFNLTEILTLSNLIAQKNIKTIILAENPNNWYNRYVDVIPATIENIFALLPKCIGLFSKQIDYLLISLCLSKARLFYNFQIQKRKIKEYLLDTNYNFLFGKYSSDKNIILINNKTIKEIADNIC